MELNCGHCWLPLGSHLIPSLPKPECVQVLTSQHHSWVTQGRCVGFDWCKPRWRVYSSSSQWSPRKSFLGDFWESLFKKTLKNKVSLLRVQPLLPLAAVLWPRPEPALDAADIGLREWRGGMTPELEDIVLLLEEPIPSPVLPLNFL